VSVSEGAAALYALAVESMDNQNNSTPVSQLGNNASGPALHSVDAPAREDSRSSLGPNPRGLGSDTPKLKPMLLDRRLDSPA
jgi:hypothetical protein